MTCPKHNDEVLQPREFQRARLSWLTSWCKRCGRMQFVLKAPHVAELENQPLPS